VPHQDDVNSAFGGSRAVEDAISAAVYLASLLGIVGLVQCTDLGELSEEIGRRKQGNT
jgi:hypothetical protein